MKNPYKKILLRLIKVILTYACVVFLLLAVWDYKIVYLKLIFTCAFINFLISEYLKDDDNDPPDSTNGTTNRFQEKLNKKLSESCQ